MKGKAAELFALAVGIGLIVVYSIVMIASAGGSGWAWILLFAGIVMLIGGGHNLRRS